MMGLPYVYFCTPRTSGMLVVLVLSIVFVHVLSYVLSVQSLW